MVALKNYFVDNIIVENYSLFIFSERKLKSKKKSLLFILFLEYILILKYATIFIRSKI